MDVRGARREMWVSGWQGVFEFLCCFLFVFSRAGRLSLMESADGACRESEGLLLAILVLKRLLLFSK